MDRAKPWPMPRNRSTSRNPTPPPHTVPPGSTPRSALEPRGFFAVAGAGIHPGNGPSADLNPEHARFVIGHRIAHGPAFPGDGPDDFCRLAGPWTSCAGLRIADRLAAAPDLAHGRRIRFGHRIIRYPTPSGSPISRNPATWRGWLGIPIRSRGEPDRPRPSIPQSRLPPLRWAATGLGETVARGFPKVSSATGPAPQIIRGEYLAFLHPPGADHWPAH